MKNEDIKYVTLLDVTTGKYEVSHVDDGPIMDGISNTTSERAAMVAQAIAIIFNLGHGFRDDRGIIFILNEPTDEPLETLEEYMESYDFPVDDDGPQDEDEGATLCAPRDALELGDE